MAATPLNVAEPFSALDGLEVVYVPVIAATTNIPTRVEINAGTDLTSEITAWEGFEVEPGEIEIRRLGKRLRGSIPGEITITSGRLDILADRGNDDVRDVLPDGTVGYIVFMDEGDTPTKLMDIWPVRVNRLSKIRSMENATLLRVRFTHDELPVEDIVIPAAV
ncbi:hypothetical protein [Pseudonocardia broussonetiae]|uniref:Phage tail protein n=1 Tax=Pseudonocardia broussonetiae TaxID=2736640 RepID=A0A6M6JGN8_9PSEU|nr:hypothetical protein [Pseudonocardia broussonetiae]QJY46656.1 hypothetical protein HOP40_13205 [Pseudonocardia broussonetiae]